MRVLFTRDVKNVGRRGEIKEVADGYAANFLIPRELAKPATENIVRAAEREREHDTARAEKLREQIAKLAEREDIVFAVKTGAHGEMFNAVTAKEIEERLRKEGYEGVSVRIERPIKTTGAHEIVVSAGKGIEGTLTIAVRPSRP